MSTAKRHLFLVLEDWEHGYTVRRFDVDSFDAATSAGSDDPEPLPGPPVILVEAEHGQADLFTALGTRIHATHPTAGAGIPVFDTVTLGLSVAPRPPGDDDALARCCPTLVAVGGDRLYRLDRGRQESCRFDVLRAPGAPPRGRLWAWSDVPARPPFHPLLVACHAVHPDGRTVFFSIDCSGAYIGNSSTFSFDTERMEWTFHGGWALPFRGQAHYDGELDAWVGLCGLPGAHGRVCSCDVVAPGDGEGPPPAWKLGAEPLFPEDEKRHVVGAALVYMGNSRFCLLECVKTEAGKEKEKKRERGHGGPAPPPEPPRRLLHVTAFGLKYGKQGELTTAMRRQRRTYAVPHDAANFPGKPVAFWM